jgi:hypothetical protein
VSSSEHLGRALGQPVDHYDGSLDSRW